MSVDQYWEAQWLIGELELRRDWPVDYDEDVHDFLLSLEKPGGRQAD